MAAIVRGYLSCRFRPLTKVSVVLVVPGAARARPFNHKKGRPGGRPFGVTDYRWSGEDQSSSHSKGGYSVDIQ
jgi:hypothetical protein